VTYNSYPNTPGTPSITGMTGSSSDPYYYTTDTSPELKATVSDPDGGSVRALFEVFQGTTLKWSGYSSYVTSGSTAKKTVPEGTLAQNTTYTLRVWGNDGSLTSKSSKEIKFRIDATPPATPTIGCTDVADGQWYDTRPASSTTCTFTSSSDTKTFEWKHNGASKTALTASSGSATTPSITIPESGVTKIEVRAKDNAGNLSGWRTFQFGTGSPGFTEPLESDRSTSTFPVDASGPPNGSGASVQWRLAGDAAATWTIASSVKLASTGAAWTGAVVQADGTSVTRRLIWNASADVADVPALVEVRVCFTYSSLPTQCTDPRQVQLLPHAFGSSFPEDAAGPGRVALFTGEMQLSQTDIEVPGYASTMALSRSHRSLAGPVPGPAGVFGPGWSANLEGPEAGLGGFEVIDHTAKDGTIVLLDPEGESYLYYHESETRGAQKLGAYIGLGETALRGDTLMLTTGGANGATHTLTITEADGTKTVWERTSNGLWVTAAVIEPEQTSITTYARNGAGLVTGIFAPTPAGVTCTPSQQTRGCRALTLHYVTVADQQRLDRVDLAAYDPRPGPNGLPGAGAGMSSITVARYAYDSVGRLTESWDPRLGDGAAALKTTYTYATVNGKTVVATATPPGQQTWRFAHDTQGRLQTVKRAHDPAVGAGDATWTVAYDVALSGSGLPDLRASAAGAWGQPEADAPTGAAGVFGPDRVPAASPTSTDWPYASLSYYTDSGRTTNTAAYGAGAWQISTTRYDQHGNEEWILGPRNRAAALADPEDAAAAAEQLATRTMYNEAGTRVEETYGPTREVVLDNGDVVAGRAKTTYVYDDEALAEGIPVPGRPDPGDGNDSHNLVVEQRTSVVDEVGEVATEWDVRRTRYRYDPVAPGDGDGWILATPTRVSVDLGDGTWSTTLTRFDPDGNTIETRTPEGVAAVDGAGSDPRSTVTVYYTADGSAADPECRNKPEWAGFVCRTGPAGQPTTGPELPISYITGYSALLSPTRVEERSGTTARIATTTYDIGGRRTAETTTLVNPPAGDIPVPDLTHSYDPVTGLPIETIAGNQAMSTTYDTWGRVVSSTDGGENTLGVTYDSAGRVESLHDGKGRYGFSYDGVDSLGRVERRGMVTAMSVDLPGAQPDTFLGAYGPDGDIVEMVYPNGVIASWDRDPLGVETRLTYTQGSITLLEFEQQLDAYDRVRYATGPASSQAYSYDRRDRLIGVQDTLAEFCTTRTYAFSLDSNRQAMTVYQPDSEGQCSVDTSATTATSMFDVADRIVDSGYSYDELGRTKTVPSAHTSDPEAGALVLSYYATDMVATMEQSTPSGSTNTKSFALDPGGRLSEATDAVDGIVVRRIRNHYAGSGDSPAWIREEVRNSANGEWEETWTRNIRNLVGELGLIQRQDGTATLQLADLKGNIVATMPNIIGADLIETYTEFTEYGQSRGAIGGDGRYGWLGAYQRSKDTLSGLILMGARVYNPSSGRFLSMDPLGGGNDNSYIYPADPINMMDVSGEYTCYRKSYTPYKCKTYWQTYYKRGWVTQSRQYVDVKRWVADTLSLYGGYIWVYDKAVKHTQAAYEAAIRWVWVRSYAEGIFFHPRTNVYRAQFRLTYRTRWRTEVFYRRRYTSSGFWAYFPWRYSTWVRYYSYNPVGVSLPSWVWN
jgi:RHS repeat-associated protein